MGDTQYDYHQLSREIFRHDTYGDTLINFKHDLVKAGFYHTRIGQKVKCFSCLFEFDVSEVHGDVDFVNYHKEKSPECFFIRSLKLGVNARPKKFLSYDSLRYEKERLETFIEWPVPWLLPDELAADGFYYLRTHDHCACVFCRGIVGAWEVGDTPRGEHKRHFPHCPFIRGQPVGNVPMDHSRILDKLPLDGEECPMPPPRNDVVPDRSATCSGTSGGRHMPGSYAECKGPGKKNLNLDDIGLHQYTGPKRKDYITKESRLKSFKRWPERVVQKPEDMADAGFFYCGLSDHVRCFHCGNGLRNWEIEDEPWHEHARWYPDCNYVLLSKGQEFIDKVRRERPPYLRTAVSKDNQPQKVSASSGRFKPISDSDLEPLMNSDIIKGVKDMGFSHDKIRMALRLKLEQTGMPFFSLEPCIETVLKIMEEETQRELQGSHVNIQVEEEARNLQGEKMAALREHSQSSHAGSCSGSADISVTTPTEIPAVIPHSPVTTEAPQQHNNPVVNTSAVSQPSSSGMSSDNAAVLSEASALQSGPRPESMEVEELAENMETQPLPNTTTVEDHSEVATASPEIVLDMQEADKRINITEESLKSVRSGPPSLETSSENEETPQEIEKQVSPKNKSLLTGKEAALELERIRESRSCKICMDAETEVVFLPCSHMATCSGCAVTMAVCPICRNDIKYTIKPIIS